MSWLQKTEPITLYQSSPIPYVVLDHVYLCFSNSFSESKPNVKEDYQIEFQTSRSALKRQSATYYQFCDFPVQIPLKNITIKTNEIHDIEKNTSDKKISMISSTYVDRLSNKKSQSLLSFLEKRFDSIFILVQDEIGENSRLFEEVCSPILHNNTDWGRTCISILDEICPFKFRGKNWTKHSLSSLDITCFGLEDVDYLDQINDIFNHVGVSITTDWRV